MKLLLKKKKGMQTMKSKSFPCNIPVNSTPACQARFAAGSHTIAIQSSPPHRHVAAQPIAFELLSNSTNIEIITAFQLTDKDFCNTEV